LLPEDFPPPFADLPADADLREEPAELLRAPLVVAFAARAAVLEAWRAALEAAFEVRRAARDAVVVALSAVLEVRRAVLRVVATVAPTARFAASPPARASLLFARAADSALLFVELSGRIIWPAVGLTAATASAVVSSAATPASAACSPACPTSRTALSMISLTTLRAVPSASLPFCFFAISPPHLDCGLRNSDCGLMRAGLYFNPQSEFRNPQSFVFTRARRAPSWW
jgi:hypothetical protein